MVISRRRDQVIRPVHGLTEKRRVLDHLPSSGRAAKDVAPGLRFNIRELVGRDAHDGAVLFVQCDARVANVASDPAPVLGNRTGSP